MGVLLQRDLVRLRLISHGLVEAPEGYPVPRLGGNAVDPAGVVSWMVAMQGQDLNTVPWAIGARMVQQSRKGPMGRRGGHQLPGAAAVLEAFNTGRIVRTWTQRGTLHTVAAEDVRAFHAVGAGRMLQSSATRHRELNITDTDLADSEEVVRSALQDASGLSRSALQAALAESGQEIGAQRGVHLLRALSLQGVLVQGPVVGREHLFVLQQDWLPAARPGRGRAAEQDPAQSLVGLLERYIAARAPVTIRDFAWWIGLPLGLCRQALAVLGERIVELNEGMLVPAAVAHWLAHRGPGPLPGARAGHLLAGFDEYLLGYQDRSAVLDTAHAAKVVPGGNGVFRKTFLSGGVTQGTWTLEPETGVVLEPFEAQPFPAAATPPTRAAAEAYEAFTRSL